MTPTSPPEPLPLTSGRPVDRDLADRTMHALHLAGLPIAHGGHGPGVHLRPAQPLDDDDRCDGLIALHWIPSPRLTAAAATEQHQQPAHRAQQLVVNAVQHALTSILPALGAAAAQSFTLWEIRVGHATPPAVELASPPLPRPTGPAPVAPGIRPEITAAVRRSAALAGLPVADRPGDPGILLRPCPPLDVEDDTTGIPDLGWNPSRRLTATPGRAAWNLREAVEDAMRPTLATALGACGLEAWWRKPEHLPAQLRAYGPSTAQPIRR
ncbi:hypothetical protein OG871_40135 (plasmid) [Kitasatospora sp. NBC_00374]|uniref:hypothetical protein n=1 Tax=Kitasatospora sp. NBC_00374 TaxID=2975964 RepID=UPI002F912159